MYTFRVEGFTEAPSQEGTHGCGTDRDGPSAGLRSVETQAKGALDSRTACSAARARQKGLSLPEEDLPLTKAPRREVESTSVRTRVGPLAHFRHHKNMPKATDGGAVPMVDEEGHLPITGQLLASLHNH